MNTLLEIECNLENLNNFAKKLAKNTNIGDIILLEGDLGVGKTTFSRFYINSLFDEYTIDKPKTIRSPSFPILINYSLLGCEIYHYDFYRLKNTNELLEIEFFEELKKNISIIEWPKIILDNFFLNNYYLIKFEFINSEKRFLKICHSNKNKLSC